MERVALKSNIHELPRVKPQDISEAHFSAATPRSIAACAGYGSRMITR